MKAVQTASLLLIGCNHSRYISRVCAFSRNSRASIGNFLRHSNARVRFYDQQRGARATSDQIDHMDVDEDDGKDVSVKLKDVFEQEGTDGVIRLASGDERIRGLSTREMMDVVMDASKNDGGRIHTGTCASMVNAIIASLHDDVERCVEWFELLTSDEFDIVYPDLVTLSCIISSILSSDRRDEFSYESDEAMDMCRRMSKKQAGSARRKDLAMARRKKNNQLVDYTLRLKEEFDIDILYENDDFIGVTKPAGMLCYAAKTKKRQRDISLVDALSSMSIPLSTINPEARGIVHRLDRGASGAMVVAKNDNAHACLVADFFRRDITKKYFALTSGHINPQEGWIETTVAEKPARSHYSTINIYEGDVSLLEVETKTGRKHQVRSHLKQSGAPIFFDPIFFPESINQSKKTPVSIPDVIADVGAFDNNIKKIDSHSYRFFLHCSSVSIPRYDVNLESKIPNWWPIGQLNVIEASPENEDNSQEIFNDDILNSSRKDFQNMTVKSLKEACKDKQITGYSNKKKNELIDLLLASK